MNVFHYYMQGALQASYVAGEPLIDEELSLVIDSGFIYMVRNPYATADMARAAGEMRVNDPTNEKNDS